MARGHASELAEGAMYPEMSIRDHFEGEYEAWREWSGEKEDPKSGDDPYGVRVPDGTAEGLFVGEVEVPFVAYRNLLFRCGGFPAAVPGDRQWTIRRELASGLLDL